VTSSNWFQLSLVPAVALASSWTSSQHKLPVLRIYDLYNDLCKFVEREKLGAQCGPFGCFSSGLRSFSIRLAHISAFNARIQSVDFVVV
jgi:hypothetical protein